ncbi:Uncharacterized protein BM_BM7912 [Brugia malayi]|uniref:Uncharacterized protein n=3 Tax=Brugia TaxID=6278 RepID=A0A4E9EY60_BRUMA|nr:Uncharacterized protein BM_BM7912 [Brugia malayi]VIO88381.1 Uncharacterized protein BM_BM7912 [Brugia malayi]
MIPQTANQEVTAFHDLFFCSKYSFEFEFFRFFERSEVIIAFYSRTHSGSIHSGRLLNESFDFDDLDAFNLLGLNFENFAEADESGYYSGDQLQNAVDRAFLFGFNGAFNRIEHGIDEMGNENRIHNHLKASGSRSWSPRSMRERHGRDFIEYRRHSYPNIARDFVYQQIDDESSDDKVNSSSNLLRMGVTTRDESPPANVASDPRESSMQQQQLQVRSRRGIKRYRMPRSLSRTSPVSAKRQRSLSLISRRNNIEYSSESNEEPMRQSSQISYITERNYPIRSRRNMRTSGRRLLPPRSLRRRRRSSQRYLRSRLYGRLRHVNSGRIKGRSFKTFT